MPSVIQKVKAIVDKTANEGVEKKWTIEKGRAPFHETTNRDGAVMEMNKLKVTTGGRWK